MGVRRRDLRSAGGWDHIMYICNICNICELYSFAQKTRETTDKWKDKQTIPDHGWRGST